MAAGCRHARLCRNSVRGSALAGQRDSVQDRGERFEEFRGVGNLAPLFESMSAGGGRTLEVEDGAGARYDHAELMPGFAFVKTTEKRFVWLNADVGNGGAQVLPSRIASKQGRQFEDFIA
jgi:hypothetical protein